MTLMILLWHRSGGRIGGAHGFRFADEQLHPFFGWHIDFVALDSPDNRVGAYDQGFGDQHYFMKNYIYGIQGHNHLQTANLDYISIGMRPRNSPFGGRMRLIWGVMNRWLCMLMRPLLMLALPI